MIHPFMELWNKPSRLVVGLMSGTSADGVDAVLITQYSATTVVVYNPKEGKKETLSLDEAEEMFLEAGNVFVSFLP